MSAAVLVAIVAALGSLIQGWDNATMAGAIIHIKREFKWENEPTMVGLTVSTSLFGATLITLFTGGLSDWLGRRSMLLISSVLYFLSALLMLWSPNVHLLLFARLLDGLAIGLSVATAPLYISEMAPPEIRGSLSTLPQFTCNGGMFLSYSLLLCMSFMKVTSWRLMLGVLSAPSFVFFALAAFYLPESPRWLMTKGRMLEAKQVLQRLRGREDVSGEMALLVEGLEVGGETEIEEYIISSTDAAEKQIKNSSDEVRLFRPEAQGFSSVIAQRVPGQSFAASAFSIQESTDNMQQQQQQQNVFSTDPIVKLFGSMHEKLPDTAAGSMFFPRIGSMFSISGGGGNNQQKNDEDWEQGSRDEEEDDYTMNDGASEVDESVHSPLISRQATSETTRMRQESGQLQSESVGMGSGWQLAWKWKEGEGSFKRVFYHEGIGVSGSVAGLVSQPALCSNKQLMSQHPVGPAMMHPSAATSKSPQWKDLCEPGVKHALFVGMGIQMLQQMLGINAVLYYTPQILEQAGVQVLLSDLGLTSEASSLLISGVMTMLMLVCVVVAMRLMDVAGRRSLLLGTNPIITASLVSLVMIRAVNVGSVIKASVSTLSVIFYSCSYAMGYGPIPGILCAEIFPTKVRGVCIAICVFASWICSIVVTCTLPMMLTSIGLGGAFGIYAAASMVAWAFVYLKVPETKGMPLEVICEFFAMGAKPTTANNRGPGGV